MFASLRFRLLLTLIVVVVVAVGTQALFTTRSTTSAFAQYIEHDQALDQQTIGAVLQAYGGPQDAMQVQALLQRIAIESGDRMVMVGPAGEVLAASSDSLIGTTLPLGAAFQAPAPGYSVAAGSISVTTELRGGPPIPIFVYHAARPITETRDFIIKSSVPLATEGDFMLARLPGPEPGVSEADFLGSVNRSVLVAGSAAGLAAVILTLLLSRGILGPVEALTAAARRMEKGDLSGRVQVRAHGEIGELAHAFNAMADGLDRLEKLRRNAVTDVAHELRTPLSNIRGYLEAVQDGVAAPTPEIINLLHEESLLLSRLVDDLQELELAEAGQLRLVRRPVALQEVIGRAIAAIRPAAADKDVSVEVTTAPDLPALDADADRLGQVLRNLLNNALTHTPSGGAIFVIASAPPGVVELRVRDTGSGIAPEHLPHIFDRFFRSDPSRARATGGAGLGLAIVRALVQAHGGTVRAESGAIPGSGATFVVRLPLS